MLLVDNRLRNIKTTGKLQKFSNHTILNLSQRNQFWHRENTFLEAFPSLLKKTLDNIKYYQALHIQIHCFSKNQREKLKIAWKN